MIGAELLARDAVHAERDRLGVEGFSVGEFDPFLQMESPCGLVVGELPTIRRVRLPGPRLVDRSRRCATFPKCTARSQKVLLDCGSSRDASETTAMRTTHGSAEAAEVGAPPADAASRPTAETAVIKRRRNCRLERTRSTPVV